MFNYHKFKKISEVSRDGRIEKYSNKSGRDTNGQDALCNLFSMKKHTSWGESYLLLSLPFLFVYF